MLLECKKTVSKWEKLEHMTPCYSHRILGYVRRMRLSWDNYQPTIVTRHTEEKVLMLSEQLQEKTHKLDDALKLTESVQIKYQEEFNLRKQ